MRNCGKLIKDTACVLGGLVTVTILLILGSTNFYEDEWVFILCVIGSLLLGVIVWMLMTGFGQLVENSDIQTQLMLEKHRKESEKATNEENA